MKRFKKTASMLLAVIMLITTMAFTATAAQEGSLEGGSITINDAMPEETYRIYQILYLESYDAESGNYAYKANTAWEAWLKTQTDYVTIDDNGYVTWVEDASAADFAQLAMGHTDDLTPDVSDSAPAAEEGETYVTVTFTNLKLGYYLVDTSVGALCSLDTTDPTAEITEKNEVPTVEKEVKEDSTGNWGTENSAQIGDTVEFHTTIEVKRGAENYVLHDQMSKGLTLNADSITVEGLTKDEDYTVTTSDLSDGCDFEIAFSETYLDSLESDDELVVSYTAVLNEEAEISEIPNTNRTKLTFGDHSETTWDETKTYSFSFDIVKTDSDNKVLDGAEFELYDAQTDGNKISLVKEAEGVYRVATGTETEAEGFVSAVIVAKDGQAEVKGLDADTTYWLEETKAPDGYNKLDARVEVAIGNSNLSTSIDSDTWEDGDGGVHIINESGSILPSTGGMGTTIFYVVGVVLMAGAVVVLISRKRGGQE